MDERVKQLWIDALNSGEYKQTKGRLCGQTENGEPAFCCLGVLTDLATKEGVVEWATIDDGIERGVWYIHPEYPEDDESFESLALPYPVAVWAALENEWYNSGEIPVDEQADYYSATATRPRSLASYNDEGMPFSIIAEKIEKNL